MINIFNRKEVYITMDIGKQWEVRDALSAAGIKHYIKTSNLQGNNLGGRRTNGFGVNPKYSYEYQIFVHRDDYERAVHIIHSKAI